MPKNITFDFIQQSSINWQENACISFPVLVLYGIDQMVYTMWSHDLGNLVMDAAVQYQSCCSFT